MLDVLEGEKLCKLGRYESAVLCFEKALNSAPQEVELLIAIYSHLGNSHFCLKDYSASLKWHKCALDLSWLVLCAYLCGFIIIITKLSFVACLNKENLARKHVTDDAIIIHFCTL